MGSASLAPQAGAVGLRAAKGTKAAGSGFLSPAARSQELAQKESQRKAEVGHCMQLRAWSSSVIAEGRVCCHRLLPELM